MELEALTPTCWRLAFSLGFVAVAQQGKFHVSFRFARRLTQRNGKFPALQGSLSGQSNRNSGFLNVSKNFWRPCPTNTDGLNLVDVYVSPPCLFTHPPA